MTMGRELSDEPGWRPDNGGAARSGRDRKKRLFLWSLSAALLGQLAILAAAQPVPQYGKDKHLGVASCASSQCHGAAQPYKEGNIRRNEYQQWSKKDKHARAFEVLSNERSRAMAKKLAIPDPQKEKLCLDCHTDNVPAALRGSKVQSDEGIGCEACHGGAERWLDSHDDEGVTHADNIAQGMYPTELPQERAKLCLSCHYGDQNKFATHRLMAAGHPRLRFELDTYTILQEHYEIDKDYRSRKKFVDSVNTWATGVSVTAAENMAVIQSPRFWSEGLFPEIALFDCHACHHPMNDRRWATRETTVGLFPGAVRLNDSSLVMLYAIATSIDAIDAERLLGAIRRLHEATARTREAVPVQSREISRTIQELQEKIKKKPLDTRAAAAIRKTIAYLGERGEFRDYTGAEQAAMALDLLTNALRDDKKLGDQMNNIFNLLKEDTQYDPAAFADALGQLNQVLMK